MCPDPVGRAVNGFHRIDVLTRISAVQAALDKVALGLLDGHTRHRMRDGAADGRADEMATEMMAAVGRLMKRG